MSGKQARPMAPVAIIGMAGRFPGAPDVDTLWNNLRDGKESIQRLGCEELLRAGVAADQVDDPAYVPCKGVLGGADLFDAAVFQMSAREAEMIDPQQRVLLECAWEALDSAGCDPARHTGAIGIWAGSGAPDYWHRHVAPSALGADPVQNAIANDKDFLATRVAYKLDLRGPAITVQSACSTSLLAIALACRAVANEECELALAGGVSIALPLAAGYLFNEGMILAPDGHCRAFDADAKGTVPADAVGMVVLKRLDHAVRDRDSILSVIRGVGVGNDGAAKIGFTAPSVEGQAAAIRGALAAADVGAETISYVEAHGTGTPLGDPIEIAALTEAFGSAAPRGGCAIGTLKSNIGHANAAAGVAGLIKTVQCLGHRELPPSLHYTKPNPHIDFAASPFRVNATLRRWTATGVRRAGVSSFGIGGTNVHAILEEAPAPASGSAGRGVELLTLSAATESALAASASRLADFLAHHPERSLADVAHTLQVGRREMPLRRTVVASSLADAAVRLAAPAPAIRAAQGDDTGVVFLFPGQGSQHLGMARDLHRRDVFFRGVFDECCAKVKACSGIDLHEVLHAGVVDDAGRQRLAQAIQPAIFTVEYALARLLMQWNVMPSAMIGHSIGEYAAACIAGVFDLDSAVRLVCERNRLAMSTVPGAMLSVPLDEEEARAVLIPGVSLAAINAPAMTVLSGDPAAIDALQQRLADDGHDCRRLDVARAMHSAAMDPILARFAQCVAEADPQPPQIPFISSVTGTWIEAEEACDPHYWARHLREPVQFAAGLEELFQYPEWTLLEVGPAQILSTLARRDPRRPAGQQVMATLPRPSADDDLAVLLGAVGGLWQGGVAVDWTAFREGEARNRVRLPGYVFDRKRYWIEAQAMIAAPSPVEAAPAVADEHKAEDIADWFYAPTWTVEPAAAKDAVAANLTWLLLADEGGLTDALLATLDGCTVSVVTAGAGFATVGDGRYTVDPADPASCRALFAALEAAERLPGAIVDLWNTGPCIAAEPAARLAALADAETRAFYGPMHMAQAIGALGQAPSLRLCLATRGVFDVAGSGVAAPERAAMLGPATVIPQEYPDIGCVTLDLAAVAESDLRTLAGAIVAETLAIQPGVSNVVALREGSRWRRDFAAKRVETAAQAPTRLRERGVYLVTGGLGGMGLVLAEAIAQSVKARLVLVGRTALPDRSQWHRAEGEMLQRIERVRAIEQTGGEVLTVAADVGNLADMQRAVRLAVERFGEINGAIHAAGLPATGVIQRKTREDAARILDPKLRGTLVLEAVLVDQPVDFILLCSSLTGLLGGFGQVDYCAANAFLDAWAAHRAGMPGPVVQSLDWDGWQQVGMAARAEAARGAPQETAGPIHPLLDERRASTEGVSFLTRLDTRRHWAIGDHLVAGVPTLVGTSYVELAHAAASAVAPSRHLVITDLAMPIPLTAGGAGRIDMTTDVVPDGTAWEISVRSGGDSAATHMVCRVEAGIAAATSLDIAAIRARCLVPFPVEQLLELRKGSVELGWRWQCLQSIHHGDGEALALIEAPAAMVDELGLFGLHPALLDMATGFFVGRESHASLPLAYGRIEIFGAMPARFYAHAVLKSAPGTSLRRLDIAIAGEDGQPIALIEDYTLTSPTLRGMP